jgi:hypothetical protein
MFAITTGNSAYSLATKYIVDLCFIQFSRHILVFMKLLLKPVVAADVCHIAD